MLQDVSGLHPFVWMTNILLCGETLFIYPLISSWTFVLLPFLAVRNNDVVCKTSHVDCFFMGKDFDFS